ncbi:MAG: Clp protein [Nocardioides sp.]|nr:Clp protein [Nocardioides sp.]
MFKPWRWIRSSNEQAVANARAAAVECGRRRVERAEVEHYLDQRSLARGSTPRAAQHPA